MKRLKNPGGSFGEINRIKKNLGSPLKAPQIVMYG
jgi:hypothetical protein